MKAVLFSATLALCVSLVAGQTKADYGTRSTSDSSKSPGLFDPSRLTVSHSMSFGMVSGVSSSIQSQSFYSTLLQYRFAAPVTLNLNFSLPIHSTFSPYQNLTTQNVQSLNYFKNIPFDVSLSWKPSERFLFNLSIINYPAYSGYYGPGYDMFDHGLMMQNRK
jgi:hypothetical protein